MGSLCLSLKPPRKPANPTGTPQAPPDKPAGVPPPVPEKVPAAVVIDKEKKTVTIPCAVAPRKLPNLNEIYPIEVIATYPAPKGQKAHETVVTFGDIKPSHVHQALEQLGLKPRAAMPALYAAVEGRAQGLPLFDSIWLLGRERALRRLRAARDRLD